MIRALGLSKYRAGSQNDPLPVRLGEVVPRGLSGGEVRRRAARARAQAQPAQVVAQPLAQRQRALQHNRRN